MKLSLIFLLFPLLFIGCDMESLVDQSETTSQEEEAPTTKYVNIFTLAPVKNVLLQDADNQVALYDENNQSYYFTESVHYPISATVTATTYVDVDYDGNITSADLAPSQLFTKQKLQSFCSEVNYLTSYYYDANLSENNISVESYIEQIKTRFDIDICAPTLENEKNAITLFGVYNTVINRGSLDTLESIEQERSRVEEFFSEYLAFLPSVEKRVEYYSAYDALLMLDRYSLQRADTGHKPNISSLLKAKTALERYNSAVDVFDIVKHNDTLFLAAGHDELASVNSDLGGVLFSNDVALLSFGSRLDYQSYGLSECLFLANSKLGVTSFSLNSATFTKERNATLEYKDDKSAMVNFSEHGITNVNSYISSNQNKRLLGVATSDKGYYLFNIKESFEGCSRREEIDIDDFIIEEKSGYAVDATFRDDGTYLYVSHKEAGITGYKTDILDKTEAMLSQHIFTLKDGQEAYNLKLFNNDNELFVTTNKGLLIYDVGSSRDKLSYVSEYLSEGAQDDYYPSIDSFEDYIFFTDGYKGIKVLKLNNSFHPMLCGVEYFAPNNSDYELAKATSVTYDDGYLYVGVTSQGIAKLKLDDLLFEHCK